MKTLSNDWDVRVIIPSSSRFFSNRLDIIGSILLYIQSLVPFNPFKSTFHFFVVHYNGWGDKGIPKEGDSEWSGEETRGW
jgi:hypothetical protein